MKRFAPWPVAYCDAHDNEDDERHPRRAKRTTPTHEVENSSRFVAIPSSTDLRVALGPVGKSANVLEAHAPATKVTPRKIAVIKWSVPRATSATLSDLAKNASVVAAAPAAARPAAPAAVAAECEELRAQLLRKMHRPQAAVLAVSTVQQPESATPRRAVRQWREDPYQSDSDESDDEL